MPIKELSVTMRKTAFALTLMTIICLLANMNLSDVSSSSTSSTITLQALPSSTHPPSPGTTEIPKEEAFYKISITSPVENQIYPNNATVSFSLVNIQDKTGNLTASTEIIVYNPEKNEIEFTWFQTRSWNYVPNLIEYSIPLDNLAQGIYRAIISVNATISSKSTFDDIINNVSELGTQTGNFGIERTSLPNTSQSIPEYNWIILMIIISLVTALLILKKVNKR
jgi:hypothetical protein